MASCQCLDVIDSLAVGVILSSSRTDFEAFKIHIRATLFLDPENKNMRMCMIDFISIQYSYQSSRFKSACILSIGI